MKLILSPKAEKQLKKLPKVAQIIAANNIRSIDSQEAKKNTKTLKGYKNVYRLRFGDYRLVYKKTAKEIYIIAIGHRKEIYQLLKQIL